MSLQDEILELRTEMVKLREQIKSDSTSKFGEGVIDALTREKNRKLNEFLDSVKDPARDIPERPGFPRNSVSDNRDALSFMPGKIQRIPMSYDYLAGFRDGVREMKK